MRAVLSLSVAIIDGAQARGLEARARKPPGLA